MTNDRELLELAAKAAGIEWVDGHESTGLRNANGTFWSPITDSGQALELAVKLGLFNLDELLCWYGNDPLIDVGTDPLAATRRAIVRAAAEIGRSTKPFPTAKEIREEWS